MPFRDVGLRQCGPRGWKAQWPRYLSCVAAAITACALASLSVRRSEPESWSFRRLQVQEDDKEERCKPARKPEIYGALFSLPPVEINFCGEITMTELVGTNSKVSSISFLALTQAAEVVTLVEAGGPIYQLNVLSDTSPRAKWDINRPPVRTFGGNSCLDFTQFCEVASITPLLTGFVVVDRHRLQEFNVSWGESGSQEVVVSTLGKMNMEAVEGDTELRFPTFLAAYEPYNSTHIGPDFPITPLFPHARSRYFFVSDTGNHRVIFLDATSHSTLKYVESFGVMGEARSDRTGFNFPSGIAVMAPTDESFFGPTIAAVFVADRRNNRIVKLRLAYRTAPSHSSYRGEMPSLIWGGEYFRDVTGMNFNESLLDPVGISIYRHFIFVCEAEGNAITILTTNYVAHEELIYVTELYPPPSIQLTGSFSTTEQGYLWFAYVRRPSTNGLGSIYLPEPIVESPPASWIEEFRTQCTNATIYNTVIMANSTLYDEHVLYVLNAARINWRFPYRPNYLSKDSFNLSVMFDLVLWNETVLEGQMEYCLPPPPATTPPMLSANEDGWNTPGGGNILLTGASGRQVTCWSVMTIVIGTLLIQKA